MAAISHDFAGAKVLLVEDDPQAAGTLEPILISKGLSVSIARDGVDALQKLRGAKPDIILLDIILPRLNGIEVCRQIKNNAATRLIPVIMLTGMSDFDYKLQAVEAGADDFLNKPFNTVELFARLKALIRNKHLNEQLDCAEDVLFTMARTIEAKDRYTQGHVERVAHLAVELGLQLGLPEEDLENLRKAGMLHDIGKIGVPDSILNKEGPLTQDEFLIVRKHPVVGAQICEKLKSMRGAIPIIRHHHERMDGSGYPDHLAGTDIPHLARVMSIADIYDALTSTRAYRKSMTQNQALDLMWEEANKGWWDKDILSEFTKMVLSADNQTAQPDCTGISASL
jgi:putative two-component system response regulator